MQIVIFLLAICAVIWGAYIFFSEMGKGLSGYIEWGQRNFDEITREAEVDFIPFRLLWGFVIMFPVSFISFIFLGIFTILVDLFFVWIFTGSANVFVSTPLISLVGYFSNGGDQMLRAIFLTSTLFCLFFYALLLVLHCFDHWQKGTFKGRR